MMSRTLASTRRLTRDRSGCAHWILSRARAASNAASAACDGARDGALPHTAHSWSSRAWPDIRIGHSQRQAALIGNDLLERLAEIKLEIVPFRPSEVRRAQDVGHRQERMIAVHDRLLLVDVDGGVAGPALAQRVKQRPRCDDLCARGVHDQRGGFHPREVVRSYDPVGLPCEPYMQGQHVRAFEQFTLAGGARISL